MAGIFSSLVRSIGPKLAIGGGAAALLVAFTGFTERAPSEPVSPTKPHPKPQPAAVKPGAPMERSRNQPVQIAAADALIVKRVLPITAPFRHGDFMWDDAGVPDGPIIVTVDLKAQTLSVFRDGYEIGAAVIIYGADDKPSPQGAFPISQKDADHVSNLYNAPMPYMLRLTNDGVAIHGSDVKWGNATHGCIGVPTAFAEKLFKVTKLGDIVVITNGKMLDTSRAARS